MYNCSSLLACPTCGPDCNYECENGECVPYPRENSDDRRNPAATNSYGFTNKYDGRIRAGIKTPPYGGVPSPTNPNARYGGDNCGCGKSCANVHLSDCYKCCANIRPSKRNNNINNNNMRGYNVNPNRNGKANSGFSSGYNVSPNRGIEPRNMKEWLISQGGTGKIERLHPLDIAGARRKIGKTYFDPISKIWKEDDGRPRGASWIPPNNDYPNGSWVWWCGGKCSSGKRWTGNKVKCPCKGYPNCACKGCLKNSPC